MNRKTTRPHALFTTTALAALLTAALALPPPVQARESLTALRTDINQNAADISSNYTDIQQNAIASQAAQESADANTAALCRIAAELSICSDIDLCLGNPECCDAATGGYCWFAGGEREGCDTVCAAQGLVYDDEGTRGYAGSDGSGEQCAAVLDDLGAPSYSHFFDGTTYEEGVGCGWSVNEGVRFRCASPTTTGTAILLNTAPDIYGQRACACKAP